MVYQAQDILLKLARTNFACCLALLLIFESSGCRRRSAADKEATITIYGFSVVKEGLETSILPDYQREWEKKTGQHLTFEGSYASSEIVANQIAQGAEADVAILAIERNADRLVRPEITRNEWRNLPYGGILNKTPMVIVVRRKNPKGIRDFGDLGKPGVGLIHCDPASSGAGQWSLLAVYGSELIKSEQRTGVRDERKALDMLRRVWKNVKATPSSAREARTQFERGEGDALITYELDAMQLLDKKLPIEIVIPKATIFSEHPVVIIDHAMSPSKYALVELFVRSLWEPEAQRAWVKAHFRSVTDEKLNEKFPKVEMPFYAKDLGGWSRAYPEIVEGVWKRRVQFQNVGAN
ncbi:MAG: substrate-binding domain-containing protein [Chloracidobacterium sp.]|nr:substrate-binding domain-containing protein [Chloracidobacterium sp.]